MVSRYDLTRLKTRKHFVDFMGIADQELDFVLTFSPPPDPLPEPPIDPVTGARIVSIPAFFRHKIPKKNKARGHRLVWEPSITKNHYKRLGRLLGKFFEYKLDGFPHLSTFGYLGGRNIRENASPHCGHRNLLCVDLEDFFGSISRDRLDTFFKGLGFTNEMADLLSRFVTIDGSLPLGLPTSPTLSNAVFHAPDQALLRLAESVGATYSRYSDDLSFSADGALPDLNDLSEILTAHGFRLADGKTRRSSIGQAHFVTGLSISDPRQPHVPKAKKRRLRQELYFAGKFGLNDHIERLGVKDEVQEQINRIDGSVKFIAFHEPSLSAGLKTKWGEILREAGARPSFKPRRQRGMPFYICIDEAEFVSPTGRMLALGLSVSQHQDEIVRQTDDVVRDALADLFGAGDIEALAKRGMHFADATEDLKKLYVEKLAAMPFEGYVVMGKLERPEDYEATYLRLLGAVIRRRLMAAESQLATILVEQNDKISQTNVHALVAKALLELRAEGNRRPIGAPVGFVEKPHASVSVPDFLLGILGRYLRSEDPKPGKPEPRDRLLFEKLRDKYRLILDVDTWTEYSRRRPIVPWTAGGEQITGYPSSALSTNDSDRCPHKL